MMREKLFRLHRPKSSSSSGNDSSSQKFDFTFSNIHAHQVPKGWDKLSLSVVSSESGKTLKKSGKGSSKNGFCQWTECFSESIWVSNVDDSLEQHPVKFLVAMGSSRSGILGEATLDLAAFLSSEASTLVSLPLKKCSSGTTLQVEIKCLTPKTNLRDAKWKKMHARKDEIQDQNKMEDRTDESKSVESCSSDKLGDASPSVETVSRETSFSSSISRYSFDSMDDSVGRLSYSSQSYSNATNTILGKQDSIDSADGPSSSPYSTTDSKSENSLQNPLVRESPVKSQRMFRKLSQPISSSTEATVQELKAEAKMWEQNARKLGVDVENLKRELAEQYSNMTNLNEELATSRSECQTLTQEIEHLRFLLEESKVKQDAERVELKSETDAHKELGDDIRFQKELNESLSLQLQKTQESNIELILVLQEMEETIENQKVEIETLSAPKVSSDKMEISCDSDSEISISEISVIDETTPEECEKCNLELELLNLQERQKDDILFLESTRVDKIIETDFQQDLNNLFLRQFEVECSCRLSAKEQEIANLRAALSGAENRYFDSTEEIKLLKEKVQELETDYNELTEENLEVLREVKGLRSSASKVSDCNEETLACKCMVSELGLDSSGKVKDTNSLNDLQTSIDQLQENLEITESNDMTEPENNQTELEKHLSDLEEESIYLSERVFGLEAQLRYLTEANESTSSELQHSKSLILSLQNEITRLEKEIEAKRLEMKQKLQEMQKEWSDAKEECIGLSKVNTKLQATTERLIEEYNLLENFNAELREQKLKLQRGFLLLQEEVRKHQHSLCNCSNEANCDALICELEAKFKTSELERVRLGEENSTLQEQLAKVSELQNEVLSLRVSLTETKSQKKILEGSLEFVSVDYEELKSESVSMVHKISGLQKEISEVEECRRKKIALEEKILRLEGDLIARDASCYAGSGTRNELNQIKKENDQFQLKLKQAEDLREELQKKVNSLEEELKETIHAKEGKNSTKSEYMEATESTNDDCVVALQAELHDLRERYLRISMKYAIVEDQREQLVMKLRTFEY